MNSWKFSTVQPDELMRLDVLVMALLLGFSQHSKQQTRDAWRLLLRSGEIPAELQNYVTDPIARHTACSADANTPSVPWRRATETSILL